MKKLNRKGFTLIELLAVIVILAIIVVVTVPTVLNSINDARLSSLHSLSKEVANWYDESYAQDLIALDPNTKILKGAEITDKWQCLGSVFTTDGSNQTLAELYGLSADDLTLTGSAPDDEVIDSSSGYVTADGTFYESGADIGFLYDVVKFDERCSAIKKVNGKTWVVLIAERNGKFNTNGDYKTYAASFGPKAADYEV